MQLFGNYRLAGTSAYARCWKIQKSRVCDFFGFGGDHITKANVHLNRNSGFTEHGLECHALTLVFLVLPNRLHSHAFSIKHEAIGFDCQIAYLFENLGDTLGGILSQSEQIKVVSGTVCSACPSGKEHRALEYELPGMV